MHPAWEHARVLAAEGTEEQAAPRRQLAGIQLGRRVALAQGLAQRHREPGGKRRDEQQSLDACELPVEDEYQGEHRHRQREVEIAAEVVTAGGHRAIQQREAEDQGDVDHVAAQRVPEADLRLAGQGGHAGHRELGAGGGKGRQGDRHHPLRHP